MASNTSVSLSEHFVAFANEQVRSGRYGSISEVVRAGLRLLEHEEEKLNALRAAIQEGLDSGPAESFDWDGFMDRKFPAEGDA